MVLGYISKIWPLIALGIIVPALIVITAIHKQYVIRPRSIIINDLGLELHYLIGKTKSVTWSDFEYMILYTGKRRYQGMKATAADLHLIGKDIPIYLTLEIGRAVMSAYLQATGVSMKYNELS
jgi:hypothetical protein